MAVSRRDSYCARPNSFYLLLQWAAGDDALDALEQAITDIPSTALYGDFSTNSAAAKLAMADKAASFDFDFVALMTVVPGKGLRTPVTVSGTGAARFEEIFTSLEMPVNYLAGNPWTIVRNCMSVPARRCSAIS